MHSASCCASTAACRTGPAPPRPRRPPAPFAPPPALQPTRQAWVRQWVAGRARLLVARRSTRRLRRRRGLPCCSSSWTSSSPAAPPSSHSAAPRRPIGERSYIIAASCIACGGTTAASCGCGVLVCPGRESAAEGERSNRAEHHREQHAPTARPQASGTQHTRRRRGQMRSVLPDELGDGRVARRTRQGGVTFIGVQLGGGWCAAQCSSVVLPLARSSQRLHTRLLPSVSGQRQSGGTLGVLQVRVGRAAGAIGGKIKRWP